MQMEKNRSTKFLTAQIFAKNKNAQIAETLTWWIATTIIVVALIISISVVNFHLKNKEFEIQGQSDLLVTKSMAGYLSTKNAEVWKKVENEKVYSEDRNSVKLDDIFFRSIFGDLQKPTYKGIALLRINSENCVYSEKCSKAKNLLGSLNGLSDKWRTSQTIFRLNDKGDSKINPVLEMILG